MTRKTRAMHKWVNCFSLFAIFIFLSQQFFLSLAQNRLQRRLRRRWLKTFFSTMKIVVVCRWYPSEKKSQQQHQAKSSLLCTPDDIKHVLEENWESESENFKVYIVVVCRHERWCEMQGKERGILKEETPLLLQIPLNGV